MRSLSRCLSSAAAVGLALAAVVASAPSAAQQSAAEPAAAAKPPAAAKPAAAPKPSTAASAAAKADVDPDAVQALKKMSAFLTTLNSFELHADTTLDLVTVDGQRIQLGGSSDYKVRKPNGFQIDVTTDYMSRRYYYDGKQFTVYAPQLGFYATAAAPPTIRETLATIEDRYGVSLPLEDLFRWNEAPEDHEDQLTSAFEVGPATVDGVKTDHYAFREGDRDWEIWIDQGPQPLPRKLVIVSLNDDARPAYVARLTWRLNPTLAADAFTFVPGPDAKAIKLAALKP